MRSTAATQSTPRVRCSTSSARQPLHRWSAARVGVRQQRGAGSRNVDVREDTRIPFGGPRHQRRVGGDADRQDDRALGAQLRPWPPPAATAARSPLTTIWPGELRLAIVKTPSAWPAASSSGSRLVRQADDRGHRAVLSRCLHLPAALADEAEAVGERDDAGGDHGAVLAHRVAGEEGRRQAGSVGRDCSSSARR